MAGNEPVSKCMAKFSSWKLLIGTKRVQGDSGTYIHVKLCIGFVPCRYSKLKLPTSILQCSNLFTFLLWSKLAHWTSLGTIIAIWHQAYESVKRHKIKIKYLLWTAEARGAKIALHLWYVWHVWYFRIFWALALYLLKYFRRKDVFLTNILACVIDTVFLLLLLFIFYIYLAGFSKRLSTCYKPSVPSTPPPLPNFPVPSSYKNGNCLNIRTSLDIVDNIHPRK